MIKKLSSSYVKIFLIISYITCWLSVSTNFDDLALINKIPNFTINEIINFLRQFLNVFIFPILIIIFLSRLNEISFKNDLIFFLSFFYIIFQIPGLFIYENSYKNMVYVISSLNVIFIFILVNLYFKKNEYLVFIKITFLMLILILSLNYRVFVDFFLVENSNVFYTYIDYDYALGKIGPRSTGTSRSWLLLFILSNFIFIKFFSKQRKIKICLYVICATVILLSQSRTMIFILSLFIFLNYFYEKKFNQIGFFKYFFHYVGYPLLALFLILLLKSNIYTKINNQSITIKKNNPEIIFKKYKRPIDTQTFSSGRIKDWESILNLVKQSVIFGFGSQGDRFLINQSASNGLIYALSSSGIIGLFFFITLSIYCFWLVVRKLSTNILKTLNYEDYYGSVVILILLARSVLESSYAVFGVDWIIFYTFINYLYKFRFVDDNGIR